MAKLTSEQIILVTGVTGRQGGAVYRHLQKKGFKLRALVRDPNSNKARQLMGNGQEVFQGSFDDPDSVTRASAVPILPEPIMAYLIKILLILSRC